MLLLGPYRSFHAPPYGCYQPARRRRTVVMSPSRRWSAAPAPRRQRTSIQLRASIHAFPHARSAQRTLREDSWLSFGPLCGPMHHRRILCAPHFSAGVLGLSLAPSGQGGRRGHNPRFDQSASRTTFPAGVTRYEERISSSGSHVSGLSSIRARRRSRLMTSSAQVGNPVGCPE